MRRKVLTILALSLVLMMAACGNSQDKNPNNETEIAEVAPTEVPTPEPTPVPTPEPTPIPTPEPTPIPTSEPTPELIEFEGKRTTGIETRYGDGTSDYEVFYEHADTQKTLHFTLTGLKSGMLPEYQGGWCVCTYYNEQDPNVAYRLYIGIITGVGSYKDMSDEIFMDCMSKDPDISTLQRIETEEDYRVYLVGKKSDMGIEDCTDYNLFIEDYATNQTYKYMVRGIPEMDKEDLLDILNNVEIISLE